MYLWLKQELLLRLLQIAANNGVADPFSAMEGIFCTGIICRRNGCDMESETHHLFWTLELEIANCTSLRDCIIAFTDIEVGF